MKEVETLRRKMVFFAKDVNLPCLRLPSPDRRPRDSASDIVSQVMKADGGYLYSTVMSSTGDLLLSGGKNLFRATKDGRAEKLFGLLDLKAEGAGPRLAELQIFRLLAASVGKDVIYIELSNFLTPEDSRSPGFKNEVILLGRLELGARCLRMTIEPPTSNFAIDPDSDIFYVARGGHIQETRFDGQVEREWPVRGQPHGCLVVPDRKSLLLEHFASSTHMYSVLDLATGQQTPPALGRTPVWGKNRTVFFLRDSRREKVLATSLYRFQSGQKSPLRIFFVSCQLVTSRDFLDRKPVLSADGSWLAWHLPAEEPENRTLLLDLENEEYRILPGDWAGIQWAWPAAPSTPGKKDPSPKPKS